MKYFLNGNGSQEEMIKGKIKNGTRSAPSKRCPHGRPSGQHTCQAPIVCLAIV